MENETEDVTYISYRNDEDKKELWRVSPVTRIAEFVVQPDNLLPTLRREPRKNESDTPYIKYQEYYTSCVKKAKVLEIRYITEYLIELGYCEFEKEGDQLHFKTYDDDPVGTIMKTKVCDTCNESCILNIDKTTCMVCLQGAGIN